MKATNEELRAALARLASAVGLHVRGGGGRHQFEEVEAAACAGLDLLDRKSCEDCRFGGRSGDGDLLCIHKKDHGPVWDRNCIPCALSKDYANDCEEYR